MQIIPKIYRAGLILVLLVLALMLGMMPARMQVSAISIQPSSQQVSERTAGATLRAVAVRQHQ